MVDHPDVLSEVFHAFRAGLCRCISSFVKAGIPIICICITNLPSGSMQSALNAVDPGKRNIPMHRFMSATHCEYCIAGHLCIVRPEMRKSYQESIDCLNEIKSPRQSFSLRSHGMA